MLRARRPGWRLVVIACAIAGCATEPAKGTGSSGTVKAPPTNTTPPTPPPSATAADAGAPQAPSTQPPMSITPVFQAEVRPSAARAGEAVTVAITIENKGPDVVHVPDPRPGGGSLVLRLKTPAGEERVITLGDPPHAGGVKPRLLNVRVLPGQKQVIDFDLGERAPIAAPGRYGLSLDYTWKAGEVWRSPEMAFTVQGK